MYNRDRRFFEKARLVAENSDYEKQKVGCVVTYKNKVIATGTNGQKTSPTQKYYNKERNFKDSWINKVHAEINALNKCKCMDLDWSNVNIYVYRICNSRKFGMARPCRACMAAIRDFGIRKIHYTTDVGFATEIIV